MILQKQARSRFAEERLVADLILNELGQVCGLNDQLQPQLLSGEHLQIDECHAPLAWQQLLTKKVSAVHYAQHQSLALTESAADKTLICGAFDPLHEGHLQMARWAEQHLQKPVHFELSVANVDKPALDYCTIRDRLAQFSSSQSVYLSRAGTFLEKSAIFPKATFLMGSDTLARLIQSCYYANSEYDMQQALKILVQRDCRFLVFARRNSAGKIETLADYAIPEAIQDRCVQVPTSDFCLDISSTDLRAKQNTW